MPGKVRARRAEQTGAALLLAGLLPHHSLPFRRVEPRPEDRYRTCVPLVSLRAAAGTFGEEQITGAWVEAAIEDWLSFETSHRFSDGMFAAKVQGRSMEPKIRDGSY